MKNMVFLCVIMKIYLMQLKNLHIDLIQIPVNIFDQRFAKILRNSLKMKCINTSSFNICKDYFR